MQQLMNEFYSKKDKKPRVPKFGTNPETSRKRQKTPTRPTFTVEEMMKTVNTNEGVNLDYDFGTTTSSRKESNYMTGELGGGTGGQRTKRKGRAKQGKKDNFGKKKMKATFGKSFGINSKSKSKNLKVKNPYGEIRKKQKEVFNDDFDEPDYTEKKKSTLKNAEFMMMMSDIKDYKEKVHNQDDINKFEEFLNEGRENPIDLNPGYGDDLYLNEPEEPQVDMKDAIKYMTREERQEYLKQKKLKRKKKFEDEMKKKNSFKPKINKKSKAIDGNRTKHVKFSRHELLFGLNTVLKQREEQLKELVEAEKFMKYAKEELNECTFHPRINRGGPATINEGSIAERSKALMEKKRRRIEDHQRMKPMNETKDCTFTPKINHGVKRRKI